VSTPEEKASMLKRNRLNHNVLITADRLEKEGKMSLIPAFEIGI